MYAQPVGHGLFGMLLSLPSDWSEMVRRWNVLVHGSPISRFSNALYWDVATSLVVWVGSIPIAFPFLLFLFPFVGSLPLANQMAL